MSETAESLRRLIKAREGKYGMAASVALAKARLDLIENGTLRFKDAGTGRYVTDEYAADHPETTYRSDQ